MQIDDLVAVSPLMLAFAFPKNGSFVFDKLRSTSKHIATARDRKLDPCSATILGTQDFRPRGGPCKVSLAPRQLYDFFFVNPHNSTLRRDAWREHCHRLEAIRVEVRRYSGHPGASTASVRSWAKSPTPACSSRATESIVPAPYRQPPPSPSICQLALNTSSGFRASRSTEAKRWRQFSWQQARRANLGATRLPQTEIILDRNLASRLPAIHRA